MTDDLDRIDALAEAAQVGAGLWYFSDSREIDGEIDAAYIAALDPQAWLAFSERLRAAEDVTLDAERLVAALVVVGYPEGWTPETFAASILDAYREATK